MRETGKDRKERIEPGYFRHADALARRRGRIVAAVLLLSLVAVAAPAWSPRRPVRVAQDWKRLVSHGDLARAHAHLEAACEKCHVPWAPINDSHWSLLNPPGHDSDRPCQACHTRTGGHHETGPGTTTLAGDASACAECHRDHRGRDASLVHLDDGACTRCHRDLDRHRDRHGRPSGPDDTPARVVAFARPGGHPDFFRGSTPSDPGRLNFDHSFHLRPGRAIIDAQDVAYQLDCQNCHAPDPTGRLMQPVSYEQHCRRCHPLPFDPSTPDRTVRHGLSPTEIVAELRAFYSLPAPPPAPADVEPDPASTPRPVPGRTVSRKEAAPTPGIEARVATALRQLFVDRPPARPNEPPRDRKGCLLCHTREGPAGAPIEALTIVPPAIPAAWLPHARFDHAAHRQVDCRRCHAGAAASPNNADALIPPRASCAECHSPSGGPDSGASDSCTECHRYHSDPVRPPGG